MTVNSAGVDEDQSLRRENMTLFAEVKHLCPGRTDLGEVWKNGEETRSFVDNGTHMTVVEERVIVFEGPLLLRYSPHDTVYISLNRSLMVGVAG